MAYHHKVNTYHRTRRANKTKRFTALIIMVMLIGGGAVGVDWLLNEIRSTQTVVSSESNATVQSAQINIFQTPYFKFQADQTWREVSDELNASSTDGSKQYLYRSFDKNLIEHELWVTVDLPIDYKLERHNVPTRVVPVQIEADGTLTSIGQVSEPCVEALPDKEKDNLTPRVIYQKDIEYYCSPNQVNDYFVAVGVPGGTTRLPMKQSDNSVVDISITYRNTTANPGPQQLNSILSTFRSL